MQCKPFTNDKNNNSGVVLAKYFSLNAFSSAANTISVIVMIQQIIYICRVGISVLQSVNLNRLSKISLKHVKTSASNLRNKRRRGVPCKKSLYGFFIHCQLLLSSSSLHFHNDNNNIFFVFINHNLILSSYHYYHTHDHGPVCCAHNVEGRDGGMRGWKPQRDFKKKKKMKWS